MTDKSQLMLLRVVLPGVALALVLAGYFLNENEWWRWTVAVDSSALLWMLSWLAILPVDPSEGRWSLLRTVCAGMWLLFVAISWLHYLGHYGSRERQALARFPGGPRTCEEPVLRPGNFYSRRRLKPASEHTAIVDSPAPQTASKYRSIA